MKTNTTNWVKIPKELDWVFNPDEASQKKRESFIDNFFGITELEKKYGVNLNSITTAKEE